MVIRQVDAILAQQSIQMGSVRRVIVEQTNVVVPNVVTHDVNDVGQRMCGGSTKKEEKLHHMHNLNAVYFDSENNRQIQYQGRC